MTDHNNDRHSHLDPVELPDGTTIWACSFPVEGYDRPSAPDFGLYLDPRWQPPWPHAHVDWPDFGLPADDGAMLAAIKDLIDRARRGQRVEVACLGGHGRTGTALACMAALVGVPKDPVEWIRKVYCEHAVETDEQAAYVRRFAARSG